MIRPFDTRSVPCSLPDAQRAPRREPEWSRQWRPFPQDPTACRGEAPPARRVPCCVSSCT